MNILLSNSTDIFAGGEDYVLILAKYLRERGHVVWVSAQPEHLLLEKCRRLGIPTEPISYTGMGRLFAVAQQLRRVLEEHRVKVVHSNANYDRTAAALAASGMNIPHIASVHSAHSIQHNITHWVRNRFGIDHFVADADAVRNVLITKDGIAPHRITVIPIGVEDPPKESFTEWKEATRSRLGVEPDTCIIGNVARLVPFKGHRYLLEAMARVSKRSSGTRLVIIGDGELRQDLEQRADVLGIGRQVTFLGFQEHLETLYPAFDVYCHSSLELEAEAFPLAVLRALAGRLPVVATRVGGIPLMVEEGASGFLVPPQDPDSLANALLPLVNDPARRNSMGAASYHLFRKKYHASTMAAAVEDIYARARAVRNQQ